MSIQSSFSSVRARMPTRFACSLAGLLAGLFLVAASDAEEPMVGLVLSDELGSIEHLEIGRSLFVQAVGLDSEAAVTLVLRDETGWPVAQAAATADGQGITDRVELWRRSGVVGCDCGTQIGAYEFARVEDANGSLAGRVFSAAVVGQQGNDLAVVPLALLPTARPLAMSADASGCPRFLLQSWEDLFLVVFGGSAEVSCSAWAPPGSSEQRPLAQLVGGGATAQVQLLLSSDQSIPGELTIWFRCDDLLGINSGLVIIDHQCPPSPPPTPPDH